MILGWYNQDRMKSAVKNKKGQVIVEYLLLMVIAIGLATFMTKKLIYRNVNEPGIIIGAWNKILISIGNDIPDCVKTNCDP